MKINKNGSIYQLAKWGNNGIEFNKSDVCTIAKHAFAGFLLSIAFIIIGVFLLTEPVKVALAVLFLLGLFGSLWYSFSVLNKARKEMVHKVETWEFTKAAYKGFKEKTCFLVEVE